MDIDEIDNILTGSDITGSQLALSLVLVFIGVAAFFVVGWLLRRAADRLKQIEFPIGLVNLGVRVVQILVLTVFVGWSLSVLGASVGWLTLLVVTALILVVFIARPFLDGLASSVVVATRSAFVVGDEIAVDEHVGEIQSIGDRSTVLNTRDGRRIHIPNSELLDKTVVAYSASPERRSEIRLTLAAETDFDTAERLILRSLDEADSITRVGSVRAVSFGEGVGISIRFWHGQRLSDGSEATDQAIRRIRQTFKAHGIEVAPSLSVSVADERREKSTEEDLQIG